MVKRYKRYSSLLLCLCLSCCLFFGCGKPSDMEKAPEQQKETETSSDNNSGDKNQPQETNKENSVPEQENDNTENQPTDIDQKDNITSADHQGNQEITGSTVSDVTFEILENYKEKNIPSVYEQGNGEEHYSNVCFNKDRELEYYTYSEDTDGHHIWKYTLTEDSITNSASWKREAVLWMEGLAEEIVHGWVKVFSGQDGNEYAWYLGNDENAHFVKREKDSFIEISGLDWVYSELIEPDVLENGTIVLTDAGRKCSIYNPDDGSLLKQFPCGFYQSLCVEGNQIYSADPTGTSVQHYNAEKNELEPLIKAGFENTIRTAIQGDDIYVCTVTGIYRAKISGGQFQKVLDAGTYHFARDSGVLLKFFVIGDAFYIVYGEDGGSIKKYAPAVEEDIATNSLNIYSLKKNDVILDMISEFQAIYPDTEIIYETGEGSDGSVTAADHIRALNARILAGDGPDILVLDELPTESYIKKGILADLNPVLGALKEELLPSFLSAYTTEGKIYMLPARISFPVFITTGQEKSVYSSLKSFVEYSEVEGGVMATGDYSYKDYLEILYYNYPPKLITEDSVNRENLTEFLELTKRLCESEDILEKSKGRTYLEGFDASIPIAIEDADFAFGNIDSTYTGLGTYAGAAEMRGGEIVSNRDVFFPYTLIGINQLSKKTKLTDIFIQFAFSYEIQQRYGGGNGFPIHPEALEKLAQIYEKVDKAGGRVRWGDLTLRYPNQKENEWMLRHIKEELHTPFTVDASIWEIIEEEALGYLKGSKSLNESVDGIAERIQLYLYEQ